MRLVLALLVVVAATLLAGAAGVECWARLRDLDRLQAQRVAVAEGDWFGESRIEAIAPAWRERAAPLLDAYLPAGFRLDDGGFDTAWGRCSFEHPGPTVLILGDSTTRNTRGKGVVGDDPAFTWPAMLRAELPDEVQLCVIAELGYHPSDQLRYLEVLGPRLEPAAVVVLLCDNDLEPSSPRLRVPRDGATVYYSLPDTQQVWRPLYLPWLHRRSEAARFLLWRLALARPEAAVGVPARGVEPTPSLDSLARMQAFPAPVLLFHLPVLRSDGPVEPGVQALYDQRRVPFHRVELGPDPEALRYSPPDPIHLNVAGHRVVVQNVAPLLRATLGYD